MIDIDVARRLRDRGLPWEPADGDLFVIDTDLMRHEVFMLSAMVIERSRGRRGEQVFRFNGTTEWALDSIEQEEAIWLPREEQLRAALGERFCALRREAGGGHVVTVRIGGQGTDEGGAAGGQEREIRAPRAEGAYAGALLVVLAEP